MRCRKVHVTLITSHPAPMVTRVHAISSSLPIMQQTTVPAEHQKKISLETCLREVKLVHVALRYGGTCDN